MKISELVDGVVELIKDSSIGFKTAAALSTRSIQQSGELTVIAPAALVVYAGEQLEAKNLTSTLYAQNPELAVLVIADDLAGGGEAARGAYVLLDALIELLGGKPITGAADHGKLVVRGVEGGEMTNGRAEFTLLLGFAGANRQTEG